MTTQLDYQQRKYQEMHLIFTPGISQLQGIYSCNSFYWSARVRQNLSQNSEVVGSFFNYNSPCQDYLYPQDHTQTRFDTTCDHSWKRKSNNINEQ